MIEWWTTYEEYIVRMKIEGKKRKKQDEVKKK